MNKESCVLEAQQGEVVTDPEVLSRAITEIMRPVMQTIAQMLKNNTTALEQLSSAQTIQNDRLEALEKQIRLQMPVTSKQVTFINDAIRQRSRYLLDKKEIDDKKAITKLAALIRKAVLARYGISSVRDIPKHEYSIAMSQIEMWNDVLLVRDVVKEVKERRKTEVEN